MEHPPIHRPPTDRDLLNESKPLTRFPTAPKMEHAPLLRRLSSKGLAPASRVSPATTPPAPPIRPGPKVWLDELPLEVCTRVASFIINFSYQSVFNFSNVSETLQTAMKNAFAGKLDLQYIENESRRSYEYSWDSGEAQTWLETDCIALLGNDVQEICLSGSQFFPQCVQDCFKSPAVTKLVIYDRPCDFEYLLHMSNLRVLDMSFTRFEGIAPFLKRMSIPVLDLQELSLKSNLDTCLHKHFSDDRRSHSWLASWFPRVEKLKLECGKCGGMESPRSYLWSAIEKFPELKEVTITEKVPHSAVDRLRQMDRVTLQDGDLFDLAEMIPHRVVGIKTTPAWYSCPQKVESQGNQFQRIANCFRLEDLSCIIQPGMERDLVKVAGNLRSLHIGFSCDEDVDNAEATREISVKEPVTGALLDALRAAPFLKSVELVSMSVRASELREMLVVLGERLEEFHATIFSMYWKKGELIYEGTRQEVEDIISVLGTAALHNPSLTTLSLMSNVLQIRDGDLVDADIAQQSILPVLPSLQTTVDVLQRRAPRLDVERWKMVLRQFRASCSQKVAFSEESE